MNIQNVHRKNRKAISPVLATVILIAITLIAAVAIATFVFGIFGTSASPAQLSVVSSSVSCVHNGLVSLTVKNAGTAAGSIVGVGPSGNFTGTVSASIPANGQAAVTGITNVHGFIGGTVQGYLVQGNGPNLYFSCVLS